MNNGVPKGSCHSHIAESISGRVNMYLLGFVICLSISLMTVGGFVLTILYRLTKSLRNYCKKKQGEKQQKKLKRKYDKQDSVEMGGRGEKYR